MNNFTKYLPSAVLLVTTGMIVGFPSYVTVCSLFVAALLWACTAYLTKPTPEPPRTDEARFTLIEHEIKEAMKELAGIKTAIAMRQLGR